MIEVLVGLGAGALFGFATAITGILKNKPEGESVDLMKAVPTVLITAIAGGIAGANGMPITDASVATVMTGLVAVGATEWINNIGKAIVRWWGNRGK